MIVYLELSPFPFLLSLLCSLRERAHGPTGRRRSCKPEIRVRFPVSPLSKRFGPVVQRRRLLAYTQATMVRVHPGSFRNYGSVGNWRMRSRPGMHVLLRSQGDRHIFPGDSRGDGRRPYQCRLFIAGKMSQSPSCERLLVNERLASNRLIRHGDTTERQSHRGVKAPWG